MPIIRARLWGLFKYLPDSNTQHFWMILEKFTHVEIMIPDSLELRREVSSKCQCCCKISTNRLSRSRVVTSTLWFLQLKDSSMLVELIMKANSAYKPITRPQWHQFWLRILVTFLCNLLLPEALVQLLPKIQVPSTYGVVALSVNSKLHIESRKLISLRFRFALVRSLAWFLIKRGRFTPGEQMSMANSDLVTLSIDLLRS